MPNFEKEILKLLKKNKEFLFVLVGSFFFFTLKIFLIYLNDTLEFMAIEYAYLFCHILLFFMSWSYHSLISFGKSRRKSFVKFFETAWTLKILDYFFVFESTIDPFDLEFYWKVFRWFCHLSGQTLEIVLVFLPLFFL